MNIDLEKTELMEIVDDIKLVTDSTILTTTRQVSEQFEIIQVGKESKYIANLLKSLPDVNKKINLTFTDFGGKHVKII